MNNKKLLIIIPIFCVSFLVGCGNSGPSFDKYNFTYYDGHSIEVEVPKGEDVRDHYPKNTESHDDGYKEYTYTWEYKQSNNYQEKQNETKISTDFTFNYADGRSKVIEVPKNRPVEEFFPTDHSEVEYHYSDRYKIVYNSWEKADTTLYNETGDNVNIYKVTYKSNPDGATSQNPEWLEANKSYVLKDASLSYYAFIGWFTDKTGGTKITVLNQSEDITIWSRFTATKYSIEYNLNGGTMDITDKDKEYTVEDTVSLKEPNKNGYNFISWYDNPNFTGSPISGWQPGDKSGPIKLYAKYSEPISYTITYTNVSQTEHSNRTTYDVTQSFSLTLAIRNGYNFIAWHKDNKDGAIITKIDEGTYGNLTLYCEWSSPVAYTINYNMPDGASKGDNPDSYTIETDTFNLQDATKKGYSFDGWHKGSAAGVKIESVTKGSYGDLNLYTTATAIKYDIEYNLNGGSIVLSEDDKKYTIEDTVTLADKTPNKNGYSFNGWYEKEDFSGSAITGWNPGDKTEKVTLYAKWSNPIEYTITYVHVESTEHNNPGTYNVTSEITLNDPSRNGWIFGGWYKEASFENEIKTIPVGTTGNITLYAKMILDKTLEEASWSEIKAASEIGTARDSFGDPGTQTKKVQLKHQDTNANEEIDDGEYYQTVRIVGYNHDVNPNGNTLGITFEFADLISDENGISIATFWHDKREGDFKGTDYLDSTLRANLVNKSRDDDPRWKTPISWYKVDNQIREQEGSIFYNKSVLDMLPDSLSKEISITRKIVECVPEGSTLEEYNCDDELFILSPKEMNILNADSEPESNLVYEYYKNTSEEDAKRSKKQIDTTGFHAKVAIINDAEMPSGKNYAGYNTTTPDSSLYHLRTSKKNYPKEESYFYSYYINFNGGLSSFRQGNYCLSVAPCFCI